MRECRTETTHIWVHQSLAELYPCALLATKYHSANCTSGGGGLPSGIIHRPLSKHSPLNRPFHQSQIPCVEVCIVGIELG